MKIISLLLVIIAFFPLNAYPVEFNDLFVESMGLGGAGTSVITSPSSAFFNPANIFYYSKTNHDKYFVSFNYGKSAYQGKEFFKYTNDLQSVISKPFDEWRSEDIASIIGSFNYISENTPTIFGSSGHSFILGKGGFAIYYLKNSMSDIVYELDKSRTCMDNSENPQSILNNQTKILFYGLGLSEYGISYSGLLDEGFYFGISLKFITAELYRDYAGLFELDQLSEDRVQYYIDRSFEEKLFESSGYTFDLGFLMELGDLGLLGFSAKNIKRIELSSEGVDLTISPQYRAGLTIFLSSKSLITIDRDLTSNELLFEEGQSKKLSIGLQTSLFDNNLVLRAGGRKDRRIRDSNWRYYLGSGLKLAEYLSFQGALHYNSGDDSFAYIWGLNLVL